MRPPVPAAPLLSPIKHNPTMVKCTHCGKDGCWKDDCCDCWAVFCPKCAQVCLYDDDGGFKCRECKVLDEICERQAYRQEFDAHDFPLTPLTPITPHTEPKTTFTP